MTQETIGDWMIQSGIIYHIHEDRVKETVNRGQRLMCATCSNTVPALVKIKAETQGESTMSADNTHMEETETPDLSEFPEENESPEEEVEESCEAPEVSEPQPSEVAGISVSVSAPTIKMTPSTSAKGTVTIPTYQPAEAVSLFFEGKPDDSVRTILKGAGFIWQPRLPNPYDPSTPGAWIGLKSSLVGTPFEQK